MKTLTNVTADNSTCGLHFSQMRFDGSNHNAPSMRPGQRLSTRTSGYSSSHNRSSVAFTTGNQVSADRRKYKRRKLKLKRIKGVELDLFNLQRVFVFEHETCNDRQHTAQEEAPSKEAAYPTKTSQEVVVLEPTDEHGHDMPMAIAAMPDANESTFQDLTPRWQRDLRTFEGSERFIEADEQWDMHSMASCFSSTASGSCLEPQYENGRRYHGFSAGVYL